MNRNAPARQRQTRRDAHPDTDPRAEVSREGAALPPPACGIEFLDARGRSSQPPPTSQSLASGRLAPPPVATGARAIQRMPSKPGRVRKTRYRPSDYQRSSKFRFIRHRRRSLVGYATKAKSGINLFTVKYKKGTKAYYLTTRSVPSTNASSFKLDSGHSEQRFKLLKQKFEKKHALKPSHFAWGATEREPCGEGVGMANCRHTLGTMGIPDQEVFFGSEYADRDDMRHHAHESASSLNQLASQHRGHHGATHERDVSWLTTDYDSEPPSEDENDVVDEYESDYGEEPQPRRKRPLKNLKGAFRDGFDG